MKQRHMRPGVLAIIGEVIFTIALLLGWILSGYTDFTVVAIALFFTAGVLGAAMAIYGDYLDMQEYKKRIEAGESSEVLLPPRVLYRLGTTGVGLGVAGFILLAFDGAWDNTIWLVIEIVSFAVGAIFLFWGSFKGQERLKSVANLQSTVIDMPVDAPVEHTVDAPTQTQHIDAPPSDSDNKS